MGCCASLPDDALSEAYGSAAMRYFGVEGLPVSLVAEAAGQRSLKLTVVGLDCEELLLQLEMGFEKRGLLVREAKLTRVGDWISQSFTLEQLSRKRGEARPVPEVFPEVEVSLDTVDNALASLGSGAVLGKQALVKISATGDYRQGMRATLSKVLTNNKQRIVAARLKTAGSFEKPRMEDVYWAVALSSQQNQLEQLILQSAIEAGLRKALKVPSWDSDAMTPEKVYSAKSTAQVLSAIHERDEEDLRNHKKGLPSALHAALKGLNYPIRGPQMNGVQMEGCVKYTGAGFAKRYVITQDREVPVLEIQTLFIRENASEAFSAEAHTKHWLKQLMQTEKEYAEFVTYLDVQARTWTIFKAFLNDVLDNGKGYGALAIAEHLLRPLEEIFSAGSNNTPTGVEDWPSWMPCLLDSIADMEVIHICDAVNWNTYMLMSFATAEDRAWALQHHFGEGFKWAVKQELHRARISEHDMLTLPVKEIFERTGLGRLVINTLKILKEKLDIELVVTGAEVVYLDSYENIAGELRKQMDIKVYVKGNLHASKRARKVASALKLADLEQSEPDLDGTFLDIAAHTPILRQRLVASLNVDGSQSMTIREEHQPTADEPLSPMLSEKSVTLRLDHDRQDKGLQRQISEMSTSEWTQVSSDKAKPEGAALSGSLCVLGLVMSTCEFIHSLQIERALTCIAVAESGKTKPQELAAKQALLNMEEEWRNTNLRSSRTLGILDKLWRPSALDGLHEIFQDGADVFQKVSLKVQLQRKLTSAACGDPPQGMYNRYLVVCCGASGYSTLISSLNSWVTRALRAVNLGDEDTHLLGKEQATLALFKEQLGRERSFLACKGDHRYQATDRHFLQKIARSRYQLNEILQLDKVEVGLDGPLLPPIMKLYNDIETILEKEAVDSTFSIDPDLMRTWFIDMTKSMDSIQEAIRTLMQQLRARPELAAHVLPSATSSVFPATPMNTTLEIKDLELATNVAKMLRDRHFTKIIALVGAGISVSANIPDFRSPGGLYDQLKKKGFSAPEAVFTTAFMKECPGPFYEVMKSLSVPHAKPTPTHFFMKLLSDKGMLLRCYTQNIDGLERKAGIPADRLVEAHGTMTQTLCTSCRKVHPPEALQKHESQFPQCTNCAAPLRPDIVFFGEPLPKRFTANVDSDLKNADLILVMGTSLQVEPFASLVHRAAPTVPRIVANLFLPETLKSVPWHRRLAMAAEKTISQKEALPVMQDVQLLGKCDDGVAWLADQAGWDDELSSNSFGI